MDQYTSQDASRSCLARVAIRMSMSRSTLRSDRCTVVTTATGRLIPAHMLARLLASMKDDDGRVTIEGWYADTEPLGEVERRAIAEAPQYDEELKGQLGIKRTEGGGKSLLELINQPSLNINGFASGDVGALARNVIPTTATAVLDLRLVKGNDLQRQVQRLVEHIRKQGYQVFDRDPTDAERAQYPLLARVNVRPGGYNAERTRMDLPISKAVIDAVQSTSPEKIVLLPTSGGSLPLSIISGATKNCDDLSPDRKLRQQPARRE